MTQESEHLAPKVHPASREILPDDPMNLHAVEVPGDTELMLRLLVEEYARMGWNLESLLELARDPFMRDRLRTQIPSSAATYDSTASKNPEKRSPSEAGSGAATNRVSARPPRGPIMLHK